MQIILYIIFWLIFGFMILKLISTFISIFSGSPSGETPGKLIKKLFQKINPPKNCVVYDLGCGLGNVGVSISKNFPVKVVGYEISLLPYLVSKIRSLFTKNFSVKYANIKKINLEEADIVYCFLLPGFLVQLVSKFKKELKKGTIIISLLFEIKGFKKQRTIMIDNKKFHIYKI